MTPRKTPILLRRGPMSGRIEALTRYTHKKVHGRDVIEAHDKYDVSADFDALVLEELIPEPESSIIAELDGAARGMELTHHERLAISDFRERLIGIIKRHNDRIQKENDDL